jgi:hypothetical protein
MQFMKTAGPCFKKSPAARVLNKGPCMPVRGNDIRGSVHDKHRDIDFINTMGGPFAVLFYGKE